MIGIESGEGNSYKVYQVIACKSHGQGKGTCQNHSLHNVESGIGENGHDETHDDYSSTQYEASVLIHKTVEFGGHQGGTLESAHQHKPQDTGDGNTTEDTVLQT